MQCSPVVLPAKHPFTISLVTEYGFYLREHSLLASSSSWSWWMHPARSRDRHVTQAWPINGFHSPGHSDWFLDEHVTQARPMRLSSVILYKLLGSRALFSVGVAWLVECKHAAAAGNSHPATIRTSLCESEASTKESRAKQ